MEKLTMSEAMSLAKKFKVIPWIDKVVSKELLETIEECNVVGRSLYHTASESGNSGHSGFNEEIYINEMYIKYFCRNWSLNGETIETSYIIGWDGKVLANITDEPVILMIKGEKVELINNTLYCSNETMVSEFLGMELMESCPVAEEYLPLYNEGITYLVGPVIRRFYPDRWDFVSPIMGRNGEDLVIMGLY